VTAIAPWVKRASHDELPAKSFDKFSPAKPMAACRIAANEHWDPRPTLSRTPNTSIRLIAALSAGPVAASTRVPAQGPFPSATRVSCANYHARTRSG
jgi:hypothetical protein